MIDSYFSEENLTEIFDTKIRSKNTKGIDKLRPVNFEKIKSDEIIKIRNRVKDGQYFFSPYLEILKIKGRHKNPRILASPTIRDKITLTALKNLLHGLFPESVPNTLANKLVSNIKKDIQDNKLIYFYRTDITSFYNAINREKLLVKVKNKISNESIIGLIERSISNEVIPSSDSKRNRRKYFEKRGVPQGLPTSNILAQIYLRQIDLYFLNKDYKYYRFVDDILIISSKPVFIYALDLRFKLFQLNLRLNKSKTEKGLLQNSFGFLGYKFKNSEVTLAESQITKFISRISGKFTWYKRGIENPESRPDWLISDLELFKEVFLNELNEKITGTISENKKYGWMFYFIEIDDVSILYRIDNIIKNFFRGISSFENKPPTKLKSILKTYFDIKYNKAEKYVHNYNLYKTIKEKHDFLVYRGKLNPGIDYPKDQIERIFEKYKNKRLSILERDIGYY
jgi:RNA-directed DNA polymerase